MKTNFSQSGFTLVEMIVSLALFSVVITISVGALLALIHGNEQLQAEQSVMTNLSFALDSMAREIRTGSQYYCDRANNSVGTIFSDNTDLDDSADDGLDPEDYQDCRDGLDGSGARYHGVAFNEGGESITGTGGRILYYYDDTEGKIFRRVGAQDAQSIVSSGLYITDAEFFVTGSEPLIDGGQDQSAVTIFIEARKEDDTTLKPYRIQTTITQRTIDI